MNKYGWLVYTDNAAQIPLAYFPHTYGTTTFTTNWQHVTQFMWQYHAQTGQYTRSVFVRYQ
jgi:hypothetical protein